MIVVTPSSNQFEEASTGWSPVSPSAAKTAPGDYRATLPTASALDMDTPPVGREKLAVLEQFRASNTGRTLFTASPALHKQYAGRVATVVAKNQNPHARNNFGR